MSQPKEYYMYLNQMEQKPSPIKATYVMHEAHHYSFLKQDFDDFKVRSYKAVRNAGIVGLLVGILLCNAAWLAVHILCK